MRWHRIHYTYGPAEDVIDVLSDPHSFATFTTILRQHPHTIDPLTAPMEVTRVGDGDGSLAVNADPRDEDAAGSARFELNGG